MNVVLLTQENCAFCTEAKAILERLASEYDLTISTLDLGTPEGEALAIRGGIMFPPGIFIEGKSFSYGRPSERKLRREFEARAKASNRS